MKIASRILLIIIVLLHAFCVSAQGKKARYNEFILGYNSFYSQQFDSAYNVFSRFVKNPINDLYRAWAFTYMGQIEWRGGDLHTAEQSLVNAHDILDSLSAKDQRDVGGFLFNLLGNIRLDFHRNDEAIGYYNKALTFFKGTDYALEVMNGKAVALQREEQYAQAISVYDSILSLKPVDQLLVARAIDNRAKARSLKDSTYPALPEFRSAIKIRLDSNDIDGLTYNYNHLSDYYKKTNPDSATHYAQKMYETAVKSQNPDYILLALDQLIGLDTSATTIKALHKQFKDINDSLQFARDTTQDRFAFNKFDFRQSKVDNLIQQETISQQRTWMARLSVIALVTIIATVVWFSIRRRKLKRESQTAIRDSKLKTSQRVHDVVANGLYGIMNELEHKNIIDKEPLINKIEDLYEKSRNISHEETPAENDTAYDRQMHELLNAFSNDETSVFIVGNQPEFWNNVSPVQKQQLQLVLKELLVNMKKHSRAKNVVVQFKNQHGLAHIHYKDDGVGLPENDSGTGKGLKNTVSRINSLRGNITFGKSERGGTTVAISFPLQSEKL